MLSLVSGDVLAIAFLLWRTHGLRAAAAGGTPDTAGDSSPMQLRKDFPYAAAIAVGVVITMWLRGMLEVLIP